MKKMILLIIMLLLRSVSSSYAALPYEIEKITDNDYDDDHPAINDNGDIVWFGNSGAGWHVYLYDGIDTTQISGGTGHDPRINNNGHIAYHTSNSEIMLYNGSTTSQIGIGIMPDINDSGYITWFGGVDGIYLYDGFTTTKITSTVDNDSYPQINSSGHVVWHQGGNVFLYDGSTTSTIGNGYFPDINDYGLISWHDAGEIYLFDGFSTNQITNSADNDMFARINNDGNIAWYTNYGNDSAEIFLYDGSSIGQITNNGYKDYYPDINNNGHIVWEGAGSDWEIYHAAPVPEPATMALFALGLVGAGIIRKRQKP